MYWKRCLFASVPGAKRSGSKASGLSHKRRWRWMIQGQIETPSPARTTAPSGHSSSAIASRSSRGAGGVEAQGLVDDLPHIKQAVGQSRKVAASQGRPRLFPGALLDVGRVREQIDAPGKGIGRGLVARDIEGRGIVHGQRLGLLR